eukprot:8398458-Pyramimonas_sp.AAC.1
MPQHAEPKSTTSSGAIPTCLPTHWSFPFFLRSKLPVSVHIVNRFGAFLMQILMPTPVVVLAVLTQAWAGLPMLLGVELARVAQAPWLKT